jgi:hypothetical protein
MAEAKTVSTVTEKTSHQPKAVLLHKRVTQASQSGQTPIPLRENPKKNQEPSPSAAKDTRRQKTAMT